MTRRRRHGLVAGVLVLVAAAAVATAVTLSGAIRGGEEEGREYEFPTATGGHMEKLREAIPGTGGESQEGPGSADEAKFAALAYPATDISAAKLAASLAAGNAMKGKLPRGKGRSGQWVSIGPSQALYPATPLRNSSNYVPKAYLAASRIPAVAIDDKCNPGQCRMWIAPSGGGIWRAKNALTGTPHWEYLSGSFGISMYLSPYRL